MRQGLSLLDYLRIGIDLLGGYVLSVEKVLGDKISSTRKFKLLNEMTKKIKPVALKLLIVLNDAERNLKDEANQDDIRTPGMDDRGGKSGGETD